MSSANENYNRNSKNIHDDGENNNNNSDGSLTDEQPTANNSVLRKRQFMIAEKLAGRQQRFEAKNTKRSSNERMCYIEDTEQSKSVVSRKNLRNIFSLSKVCLLF